jgi:hypothetical protein
VITALVADPISKEHFTGRCARSRFTRTSASYSAVVPAACARNTARLMAVLSVVKGCSSVTLSLKPYTATVSSGRSSSTSFIAAPFKEGSVALMLLVVSKSSATETLEVWFSNAKMPVGWPSTWMLNSFRSDSRAVCFNEAAIR